MKAKIELEIRNHDIDKNKIDTKKILDEIIIDLQNHWDITSLDWEIIEENL